MEEPLQVSLCLWFDSLGLQTFVWVSRGKISRRYGARGAGFGATAIATQALGNVAEHLEELDAQV